MKRKIIVETTLIIDIKKLRHGCDISDKTITQIVESNLPQITGILCIADFIRGYSCTLKSIKKHQKINIVPVKE